MGNDAYLTSKAKLNHINDSSHLFPYHDRLIDVIKLRNMHKRIKASNIGCSCLGELKLIAKIIRFSIIGIALRKPRGNRKA